jgi:hypothetical protein
MVGHTLVRTSVLCVAAKFAVPQQPTLHLEYISPQHKNVRVGSQPIRAPSTDRISLVVALEPLPPGAQQAGGERLEVRAENQAPGYFENRPPANVSIVVRSVDQHGSHEVPFKVYSSGGGLDPQKLCVFVDLDILADPIARHVKLRELAARMMAADRKKRGTDSNGSSMLDAVDTPKVLIASLEH